MRRLGTLGEGGFLMRNNLYGLGVERTVRYDVHELKVPGWQSIIGQPIEEALGLRKGQKAILGYYNGNPVYANGSKNYIENVYEMGEGVLGIEVRETVGFGTGTKIDVGGIKGLVSGVVQPQGVKAPKNHVPPLFLAPAPIQNRVRPALLPSLHVPVLPRVPLPQTLVEVFRGAGRCPGHRLPDFFVLPRFKVGYAAGLFPCTEIRSGSFPDSRGDMNAASRVYEGRERKEAGSGGSPSPQGRRRQREIGPSFLLSPAPPLPLHAARPTAPPPRQIRSLLRRTLR